MFTLNCKGRLLSINTPIVMGILNITPDSFYAQSRLMSVEEVLERAGKMLAEGAAILDIGGQSTRPGSTLLAAQEEMERVIPVIKKLHQHFPHAILSADTFYACVAKEAVRSGASIINDVSSGEMDEAMLSTVAALNVPFICMHKKGMPETMQQNPSYDSVVREVLDYFVKKIVECKQAGINDVIIDPGFGFGKKIEHNYQLLKQLHVFKILDKPILAGLSRKAMIYKTLHVTPEEALNGTTVLNTLALQNGAAILRVHDVREAIQAITLYLKYCDVE